MLYDGLQTDLSGGTDVIRRITEGLGSLLTGGGGGTTSTNGDSSISPVRDFNPVDLSTIRNNPFGADGNNFDLGSILGNFNLGDIFGNNNSNLMNLILGGLFGAGEVGNILNAKTQSDFVQQMIDWRKYLQGIAKDPTQAVTSSKPIIDMLTSGLNTGQINSDMQALLQPLSQGLIKGVGNQVQSTLAQRGMSQTPGVTTDILAQSLAPYQQDLLKLAEGGAFNLAGMNLGAKETGVQDLLSLLRLPTEGQIPPFLPQTDLTPLLQMLMGKGASKGAGSSSGGSSGGSITLPGGIKIPWPGGKGTGTEPGAGTGGAHGSSDGYYTDPVTGMRVSLYNSDGSLNWDNISGLLTDLTTTQPGGGQGFGPNQPGGFDLGSLVGWGGDTGGDPWSWLGLGGDSGGSGGTPTDTGGTGDTGGGGGDPWSWGGLGGD